MSYLWIVWNSSGSREIEAAFNSLSWPKNFQERWVFPMNFRKSQVWEWYLFQMTFFRISVRKMSVKNTVKMIQTLKSLFVSASRSGQYDAGHRRVWKKCFEALGVGVLMASSNFACIFSSIQTLSFGRCVRVVILLYNLLRNAQRILRGVLSPTPN